MSGSRFYDSTAQAERILCANKDAADSLGATISEGEAAQDRELEEILSRELLSQRKPRNKGNGVAKGTKSAPSAPATDVVDGGLAAEA